MNVDDQYCLELLHRSIVQQDAQARKIIHHHFSELLCHWLHCHPKSEMAYQLNSEEHYVTQALERFWHILSPHQLEAANPVEVVHNYLRISLNSTIMDTVRTSLRSQGISAVVIRGATKPLTESDDSQCVSWEVIEHMLPNRRTSRLAYLLFYCGLKPKAIISTYPQEFSDIQEIYRLWPAIAKQLSQGAIGVHQTAQDGNTELRTPSAP